MGERSQPETCFPLLLMANDTDLEYTLNRSSLSDQVAAVIRDQVLSGRLRPGELVLQVEWAQRLGVSRMPVRDAIRRLCAEGVLVSTGGNSAQVIEIDPEDVRFAYELSALALSFAARRAAKRASDDELKELEGIHADFVNAVQHGDTARLQRLNWQFHRAITRAAHSPQLQAVLRILSISVPLSSFELIPDWPELALKDHEQVLSALKHRDASRAAESLLHHVSAVTEPMVSGILSRLKG